MLMILMIINMYLIFLKVLELSECRRGDAYMTANRNFVTQNSRSSILANVRPSVTLNLVTNRYREVPTYVGFSSLY